MSLEDIWVIFLGKGIFFLRPGLSVARVNLNRRIVGPTWAVHVGLGKINGYDAF